MSFQMTGMNKAWWTVGAGVGSLSRMSSNVNCYITFKCCSEWTKWARIWFFSCMRTDMKLKITPESWSKRTMRTRIWLFSSVCSNMAPYSSWMLGGVDTVWTPVDLVPRVDVYISLCSSSWSSLCVFFCDPHFLCTIALTITFHTHLWETPVLFLASECLLKELT